MTEPHTCTKCDEALTDAEWLDRHTVNETAAALFDIEQGDYHDECCPLCAINAEVKS